MMKFSLTSEPKDNKIGFKLSIEENNKNEYSYRCISTDKLDPTKEIDDVLFTISKYNEEFMKEFYKLLEGYVNNDGVDIGHAFITLWKSDADAKVEKFMKDHKNDPIDITYMTKLYATLNSIFTDEYLEVYMDNIVDKTLAKYPTYKDIDKDFFNPITIGFNSTEKRFFEISVSKHCKFDHIDKYYTWLKIFEASYILDDDHNNVIIKDFVVEDDANKKHSGYMFAIREDLFNNTLIIDYINELTTGELKVLDDYSVFVRGSKYVEDIINVADHILEYNIKPVSIIDLNFALYKLAQKTVDDCEKEIAEFCQDILFDYIDHKTNANYIIKKFVDYMNNPKTVIKKDDLEFIGEIIGNEFDNIIEDRDNTLSMIARNKMVKVLDFEKSIELYTTFKKEKIKLTWTQLMNYIDHYEEYKELPISWAKELTE